MKAVPATAGLSSEFERSDSLSGIAPQHRSRSWKVEKSPDRRTHWAPKANSITHNFDQDAGSDGVLLDAFDDRLIGALASLHPTSYHRVIGSPFGTFGTFGQNNGRSRSSKHQRGDND